MKSCDEIIALGCSTSEISWRDAAEHLEPAEFHKMLLKHAAQQAQSRSTAIDANERSCPGSDASRAEEYAEQSRPAVPDDPVEADCSPAAGPPARHKAAGNGLEADSDADTANSSLVLLDCRNLYESEIGRFEGAVRCPTRHFTEFPAVADQMVDDMQLRDKTVLMYCTGGIRCERASAYLRSVGVQRCFQLKGGIAKYCEAFPAASAVTAAACTPLVCRETSDTSHTRPTAGEQGDCEKPCAAGSPRKTTPSTTVPMQNCSMFRGKNFVFDRRMALPAGTPNDIVGECVLCGVAWDQYDRSVSCEQCAALVLLCGACRPRVRGGPNQPTGRRKRKQIDDDSRTDGTSSTGDDNTSSSIQLLCTYCRSGN